MPGEISANHLGSLLRITAAVGLRDDPLLQQELNVALNSGITVGLIREVILQSYLFAGYAAAINAFVTLNRIAGTSREFWREEEGSVESWRDRGTVLCKQIYATQFEKLLSNMRQLHPDLGDWMLWEGYGKVLSRPFLSPRIRELLIVAMTAVLCVERQFHSHVRGALHVGATVDEVKFAFDQVVPYIPLDSAARLAGILTAVVNHPE